MNSSVRASDLDYVGEFFGYDSADEWICRLNYLAQFLHWDAGDTLLVASHLLRGKAQRWFTAHKPSSWEQFESLFLERFGASVQDLLLQWEQCCQQWNETASDYSSRFTFLLHRLGFDDTELATRHFTTGLLSHLQEAVVSARLSTLTQVIEFATYLDDCWRADASYACDAGTEQNADYVEDSDSCSSWSYVTYDSYMPCGQTATPYLDSCFVDTNYDGVQHPQYYFYDSRHVQDDNNWQDEELNEDHRAYLQRQVRHLELRLRQLAEDLHAEHAWGRNADAQCDVFDLHFSSPSPAHDAYYASELARHNHSLHAHDSQPASIDSTSAVRLLHADKARCKTPDSPSMHDVDHLHTAPPMFHRSVADYPIMALPQGKVPVDINVPALQTPALLVLDNRCVHHEHGCLLTFTPQMVWEYSTNDALPQVVWDQPMQPKPPPTDTPPPLSITDVCPPSHPFLQHFPTSPGYFLHAPCPRIPSQAAWPRAAII